MTRWKASGLHLCLSILVIGGIATLAFTLWYPHGLYQVAGLDRLLLVMLGIDLTAGPLLTLLLYKPGKWGLKFDLGMIAVMLAKATRQAGMATPVMDRTATRAHRAMPTTMAGSNSLCRHAACAESIAVGRIETASRAHALPPKERPFAYSVLVFHEPTIRSDKMCHLFAQH